MQKLKKYKVQAGLLIILFLLEIGWILPKIQPKNQSPNIILFVVDTLRADHLQCYGYSTATSPNLDQFTQTATMFENAFTAFPATTPSFASIMTGKYLYHHGVLDNNYKGYSLAENQVTLAEILKDAGYKTGAFVSGWTVKHNSGLYQGFDIYNDLDGKTRNSRPGKETIKHARKWLEQNHEQSFFLFVHLFDPHGPYLPPYSEYSLFKNSLQVEDTQTADLEKIPIYQRQNDICDPRFYITQYDREIHYADSCLAEILSACQELDLTGNTMIIITADHGEEMTDRNKWFDHGCHLFDEQVRIPLLIHLPGQKEKQVIDRVVRSIDLAPTILEQCCLNSLPQADGAPIQLNSSYQSANSRTAFLESGNEPGLWSTRGKNHQGRCYGLRTDRWKLIYTPGITRSRYALYDVASDPGETMDVAYQYQTITCQLASQLNDFIDQSKAVHNQAADSQERPESFLNHRDESILRAIGYLE